MPENGGMRQPAGWMVGKDDRVLEVLRDEGNMTPLAVSREGKVPRVDMGRKWASGRLRELYQYRLVEEVDKGLYRISEQGLQYLDEELDASELEPVEE